MYIPESCKRKTAENFGQTCGRLLPNNMTANSNSTLALNSNTSGPDGGTMQPNFTSTPKKMYASPSAMQQQYSVNEAMMYQKGQQSAYGRPVPHSSSCPVYKNQQKRLRLQETQRQQGHQGSCPTHSNTCAPSPNSTGCKMNESSMDPSSGCRQECITAISSMRSNLYEGTQKVMQCIQTLNGLDHFLRASK